MTWFVARNLDGSLASIHRDHMPGDNDEQLADDAPEVVAFLAAAAPKPPMPSPREWLERLAPATQQAISQAALANPAILLWMLKASGSSQIDVTLPETIAGIGALVNAGVLTADDQATLLVP